MDQYKQGFYNLLITCNLDPSHNNQHTVPQTDHVIIFLGAFTYSSWNGLLLFQKFSCYVVLLLIHLPVEVKTYCFGVTYTLWVAQAQPCRSSAVLSFCVCVTKWMERTGPYYSLQPQQAWFIFLLLVRFTVIITRITNMYWVLWVWDKI